jgi:hypothetical protein
MREIQPALSPEEWAGELAGRGPIGYHELVLWDGYEHAIAAIALHGQPFGFTHADVEALLFAADHSSGAEDPDSALRDLARRIAALLPPQP